MRAALRRRGALADHDVRLATDAGARAYLERRVSEGKTEIEAARCIKRYIARKVFASLLREAVV